MRKLLDGELEVLKAALLVLQSASKDELNPTIGTQSVHRLAENALQNVIEGNGEKRIFITSDDEGNGYHGLFYLFEEFEESVMLREDNYCFDGFKDEEIMLLG